MQLWSQTWNGIGQECENHRAGVPAAGQMRMARPASVMAGWSMRRPDLPGVGKGREAPGGERICGYGILHFVCLLVYCQKQVQRGQYSKRNRLMAIGRFGLVAI